MSDRHEVKLPWVRWGKVGDYIEGNLADVREVNSNLPGKEGERVKVYEIKARGGEFHLLDDKKNPVEPAEKVEMGEIYMVGGRQGIDAQMRRIKIGQDVELRFTDEKPSKKKGFNALKIIKVLTDGTIDEDLAAGRDEINPSEVV